jgi:carbon-monoxide dehydrogenase large subunit
MARYEGLVTGAARYAADVAVAGALHLVFVRSTEAHARLVSIDVTAAVASPGVVGVYTSDDLGLVDIYEISLMPEVLAQPALARGVVRYVGERIVAIVGVSLAAALDAAELVGVEYEPLPLVLDVDAALAPHAPVLHPVHTTNVAVSWSLDAPAGAFDGAEVVVSATLDIPRVAVAPMEGLSITVVPEPDGRLTLHASTQSPQATVIQTARTLGIPMNDVRVLTPRVGGAFGGKALGGLADYAVAAAIARRLDRPVRCVEPRGANLAQMHGRGQRITYRMHARRDGTLVGLEIDERLDCGAYPVTNAVEPGKTLLMACGPYRLPAVAFHGRSIMTNRAPTGAYRGPGRSDATAVLEHGLDRLARTLGLDPIEVRRRNLLRADELPCETVTGAHNDEGDYHAVLDALVAGAGLAELRREQAHAIAVDSPKRLGIGVALALDATAWFARTEPVQVHVDADGVVTVVLATASAGQEHGAAIVELVAAVLPVDPDDVVVIEGDSDRLGGTGTSGSRSLQLAGAAVAEASHDIAARARAIAAEVLEAAVDDIVVDGEAYVVRGVPARRVRWREVAARAHEGASIGAGAGDGPLDARCVHEQGAATYPFSAHLAVVALDVDTGELTLERLVVVTDCGRVVDDAGASGQVVGASVQGVGQALFEQVAYDEHGTPTNASLAEYLVPSAAEVPSIESSWCPSSTSRNVLGARGVGEIGLIGAPAAVHAAVLDALSPLGVEHVDLPCTPQRVWRALRDVSAS